MDKKAQLKIQEMSFMLIAVFIFFILVGLFALSIITSNLQKSAEKIVEEKVLSSVIKLANSPEFNCRSKINCVDADKLIGLMNNKNYQNFWSLTSLQVVKESGFGKSEGEMVNCNDYNYLYDYDNCDRFLIYDKNVDNEQLISSFVALCRIEYENYYAYDRCEIAKLVLGREMMK